MQVCRGSWGGPCPGLLVRLGPGRPLLIKTLVVCSCTRFNDGETAPASSLLQWGSLWLHTQRLCVDVWGHGLAPWISPVHHRGPPFLTPWKTQCAPSSLAAECPSMECQSIDHLFWLWSCAGLGAQVGEHGTVPSGTQGHPSWVLPWAAGGQASLGHDGTAQGERYCNARGEILRPLQDQLQRRRSASARSSIKNVSVGSEDDQTPS